MEGPVLSWAPHTAVSVTRIIMAIFATVSIINELNDKLSLINAATVCRWSRVIAGENRQQLINTVCSKFGPWPTRWCIPKSFKYC